MLITTNVGYPTKCARAAQRIACKGRPVFPCREDKSPLTQRGFKDATTNPGLVKAFWTKHPDALIGMPTGSRSGYLVVDVDQLGALEELGFELPETLTVETPRGGRHYYFKHVEGLTNSPGGLPSGIDIRGEGGYCVVPPSRGYRVINQAPVADIPVELLTILREQPQSHHVRAIAATTVTVDLDSIEPIPEGCRNNTLARIAGTLRSRGLSREELEDALSEINLKRCSPALEDREVKAVAASISRYEPGKAGASPETMRYLDELEHALWGSAWPKVGGKTERSLVVEAVRVARKHGRRVEEGVEVSLAHSQLALGAATSTRTVSRVLRRSEWIRQGRAAEGEKAGSVILTNPRANCHHSNHRGSIDLPHGKDVDSLRAPFRAPRLRWSAPGILRLGKSAEAVIDYLERVGGSATVEELAEFMCVSRLRDFKRRVISRLEERGVVSFSESGETVSLVENWLDALNAERGRSGEIDKLRLDLQKFNRRSEAYRKRLQNRPEEHDGYGLGEGWERLKAASDPAEKNLSPLARKLYEYLYQNPHDASQPPLYFSITFWALKICEGKPPEGEIRAALKELGGDGFRITVMNYARERDKRARAQDRGAA
jgi:hypothetical protein